MGFTSFAGRVLFSAIFIFSAYHMITQFGNDGGPAAKALKRKIERLRGHVDSSFGVLVPAFEIKYLIMAFIALDGLGGILFILGSNLGAYSLLLSLALFAPLQHDFYNHDISESVYAREFIQFLKSLSMFGALLFYLGMKNYATKKARNKAVKSKAN